MAFNRVPGVRTATSREEAESGPAQVGGARAALRAQVAGLDYKSGMALLAPPLPIQMKPDGGAGDENAQLPDAIPKTPDEMRESIDYASVSASAKDAQVLAKEDKVTLKMAAGTRLTAGVGRRQLTLQAHPGLIAEVDWSPDAVINSLTWDFTKATFTAEAEGLGPDFLYSNAVAKAANKHFKPKLPAAMQQAGYSPQTDKNFPETIKQLGSLFGLEDGASEAGGGDGESPMPEEAKNFTDAHAGIYFHLKGDLVYPLAGGEAELRIAASTGLSISMDMAGSIADAKVQQVVLQASGGSIEIKKIKGFAASLQGLSLHSVVLHHGGRMTFSYDLSVEDAIEGVTALFRLFGALAGDPSGLSRPIEQARLEGVRAQVDAKLQEEVGPRLIELIRQYDSAIPGVSLVKAFGL